MLVNINKNLDNILEKMLFNSMINPNNKELYIKTMSLETLAKLMAGDDDEKVATVWRVIHRAIEHITIQEQEQAEIAEQELLDLLALEPTPLPGCPRCGYEYANGYKVCPNCACEVKL